MESTNMKHLTVILWKFNTLPMVINKNKQMQYYYYYFAIENKFLFMPRIY